MAGLHFVGRPFLIYTHLMKQTLNAKLFALLFMPVLLLSGCKGKAEIGLPAIFSDNLVLRQNTDVTK